MTNKKYCTFCGCNTLSTTTQGGYCFCTQCNRQILPKQEDNVIGKLKKLEKRTFDV